MSTLIASYWFKSDTSERLYETLVYDDGKLTCNCPGWTRRNDNGIRMCKHTRLISVDPEFAKTKAEKWQAWERKPMLQGKVTLLPLKRIEPAVVQTGERVFDFEKD